MDEDRNNEPGERLKNILAADKEDENASLKSLPQTQSPLEKLPRLKPVEQIPPQVDVKGDMPKPAMPVSPANLGNLPTSKQPVQSVQQPVQQTSKQAATSQTTQDMPRQEKLLRALWTMTSLISMAVNVVAMTSSCQKKSTSQWLINC
jgi:hypothetical protein